MYKKGAAIMILCNMIIAVVCVDMKGIELNIRACAYGEVKEAYSTTSIISEKQIGNVNVTNLQEETASRQRVVKVNIINKQYRIKMSQNDYENLLKIVEAEAGGEDRAGKLLVANVVLNRVEDESFPDTITEVIYQRENGVTQFSPTRDGRIDEVHVSKETVEAVDSALMGEDISQGALYFASRKSADSNRMEWFDLKLTRLFSHGGHEFFI